MGDVRSDAAVVVDPRIEAAAGVVAQPQPPVVVDLRSWSGGAGEALVSAPVPTEPVAPALMPAEPVAPAVAPSVARAEPIRRPALVAKASTALDSAGSAPIAVWDSSLVAAPMDAVPDAGDEDPVAPCATLSAIAAAAASLRHVDVAITFVVLLRPRSRGLDA